MSFRTYHDLPDTDGSGLGRQIARQRARVAERLALVERVVVVLSGKGGVGKSYVTAALALAAAWRGLTVGVMDADLHSPTVARLLGVPAAEPLTVGTDGMRPATGRAGIGVVSTDLLLDEGHALHWAGTAGEAHAWRGAAEASVLREFLGDVRWGELAVLLVDMPPDAGRLADLAALLPRRDTRSDMPAPAVSAVAVTIPTDESARSVARALDAARDAGLPVVGLVENMRGHACDRCGEVGPLFSGEAGQRLAAAHGVPLLAALPFSAAPLDDVARALAPVVDRLLTAVS